jgi:hypothetical protein
LFRNHPLDATTGAAEMTITLNENELDFIKYHTGKYHINLRKGDMVAALHDANAVVLFLDQILISKRREEPPK